MEFDAPPPTMWHLRWDEAHRLVLQRDATSVVVSVTCCFPWSHPHSYISLRNDKGVEQAFVGQLHEMSPQQQSIVEEALRLRNFIPQIVTIHAITDDQELYIWSVTTDAGERKFLTERRDHVRELPGGKVLIRDVANDVMLIPDPKALDAKSYAWLRAQMD